MNKTSVKYKYYDVMIGKEKVDFLIVGSDTKATKAQLRQSFVSEFGNKVKLVPVKILK